VSDTCADLARLYRTQGDMGKAETHYRRALTIQQRHALTSAAATAAQLADLLEQAGKSVEGQAVRERARTEHSR
jgi:uncharacterized protein HemY